MAQSDTLPGQSNTLPGQDDTLPGKSDTLPGQSDTLPGNHNRPNQFYVPFTPPVPGMTAPTVQIGRPPIPGCLSTGSLGHKLRALEEVFVGTSRFDAANEKLQKYGHVTLTGPQGEGKTSIALAICDEYQRKGYKVEFVHDVDRFEGTVINTRDGKVMLVFDDIFGSVGKPHISQKHSQILKDITDALREISHRRLARRQTSRKVDKYDIRFIFTSKLYFLNEGRSRLFQYSMSIFRKDTVVDLKDYPLTTEEKRQFIYSLSNYYQREELSDSDIHHIIDTSTSNEAFGFPLTCKMYFSNVELSTNPEFFSNPVFYLRKDIDTIIRAGNMSSALFILLLIHGGRLDLVRFQSNHDKNVFDLTFNVVKEEVPSCTKMGIWNEAHNYNGTYLTIEDHVASFSHPSVYDAVACAYGTINPVNLLTHCKLNFLHERVKSSLGSHNKEDKYTTITVTPSLFPLLVSRLIEGFVNRNFSSTITHDVFRDDEMVQTLINETSDQLSTIVEDRDKSTGESYLHWATFAENIRFVELYLQFGKQLGNEMHAGLMACATNKNMKATHLLVDALQEDGNFNYFNYNYGNTSRKTLLMEAATSSNIEMFHYLVKKGADITLRDLWGRTALHYACASGKKEIVKELLQTCDINQRDFMGKTPLMVSAILNHTELTKFLLDLGADASLVDEKHESCLHIAAWKGNNALVSHLLTLSGTDVNQEGPNYRTPILTASLAGNQKVFEDLLAIGADVQLTDDDNQDCLAYACSGGNVSIVNKLAEMEIFDVNRKNFAGHTPLMSAVKAGNIEVFRCLLNADADVSLEDDAHNDCLNFAAHYGHVNILNMVLSMRMSDINRKGSHGRTPVLSAVLGGHTECFYILERAGVDLSLCDDTGDDALRLAVLGGRTEITKTLLSMKAYDINRHGYKGQTPLITAAMRGNLQQVEDLLNAGADVTAVDVSGYDAFFHASQNGMIHVAERLLCLEGVDINKRGANGETAVILACGGAFKEMVQFLVNHGADISLQDDNGYDCVSCAARSGHDDILEYLLPITKSDINVPKEKSLTPVLAAANCGQRNVFNILVAHGGNIGEELEDGTDCLTLACIGGDINIVNYLLSTGRFDVNKKGHMDQTIAMFAARLDDFQILQALISSGADVLMKDCTGMDCLMEASRFGKNSTVRYLLSLNLHDVNAKDKHGMTSLLIAARNGHKETFEILLQAGYDISVCNNNNEDCVINAAVSGNVALIRYILSCSKPDLSRRGHQGQTALLNVVRRGFITAMKVLLEAGADPQISDVEDTDCLMHACSTGNVGMMRHLISLNCFDVNRRNGPGDCPLVLAAEQGNVEVFRTLAAEGGDVLAANQDGIDCLNLACRKGKASIVSFLLSFNNVDINVRDSEHQTPAMHAAVGGHVEVMKLLIKASANLSLADNRGCNCLMLASKEGQYEIVKLILATKSDIDVNQRDRFIGRSAVMLAALMGRTEIYLALEDAGSCITLADKDNNNCLHLACIGGSLSLVSDIINKETFDVNAAGQFKQTAVMLACEGGHSEIFDLLVAHGADLTVIDESDEDVLIAAASGGSTYIVESLLKMNTFNINRQSQGKSQVQCQAGLPQAESPLFAVGYPTKVDPPEFGTERLALMGAYFDNLKDYYCENFGDMYGEFGRTALMAAAKAGKEDVVRQLVKAGADVQLIDDNDNDCLVHAASGGNAAVVGFLLTQHIRDIDWRGADGQTPVMVAALEGQSETFDALAGAGANLSITDQYGDTCLKLAERSGNMDIINYLRYMPEEDDHWAILVTRQMPGQRQASPGNTDEILIYSRV